MSGSFVRNSLIQNMYKEPITILGINPSGKYIGIAVFQGSDLRDWRVKVINGKWSKEKMGKILLVVNYFIRLYDPDVLAIKKLTPCRTSPDLENLISELKNLSKKKKLRIYQYSIKDLEAFFSAGRKLNNKRQLARTIAADYPILFHELNKEFIHKNPYHMRMFEAVALGAACFSQLDAH